MHNSTKTTTFSGKERSHIQNYAKTTTFSVKKGRTCKTTLKQQHLV